MQSCGTNAKLHACTPICMRQSVAALLACHDVLCQTSPQDRLTLELHMLSYEVSILLASKGHQQRCVRTTDCLTKRYRVNVLSR